MKFKPWFLILFVILIGIIYVSLPKTQADTPRIDADSMRVIAQRKAKDETFKTGDESPIQNKSSFKGLTYFPYSPTWKISFRLTRNEKIDKVKIKMTDGSEEELIALGILQGNIANQQVELIVYQHEQGDLFIPFKDKTAPTETYGGGRYLELPLTNLKDNQLIIDFNEAFFPFCAYNHTFACPVPPAKNNLAIRIPVGEKNP